MSHTLCFSGMDRAEEAKLKLLFADANEWLGGDWTLAPENSAEVLVIDLESMYGHMTWLKVHNSGRYIIALSSREQQEAEHLLLRPVTVESLVAALSEATGQQVPQRAAVSAGDAMASARQAGADSPTPQTGRANRPQPETPTPPPAQQPTPREPSRISKPLDSPTVQPPSSAAITSELPAAPATAAPEKPAAAPVVPPRAPPTSPTVTGERAAMPPRPTPPPAKPREPVIWDYLHHGKLFGPSKLELEGSPPLIIDPESDTYIGGDTLKPYIPYCELGIVPLEQWQPVNAAALKQFAAQLGGPQPLARLRWLHALVQGGGALAPGYDPNDKFRLTRWPKTEREFPRHFRIATVMMQGPATLAEIAVQSNTTRDEVTDFVNASLDSGFAEPYSPQPTTPDTPTKSGGLLGRLRGR
jgi:hypothetical protein